MITACERFDDSRSTSSVAVPLAILSVIGLLALGVAITPGGPVGSASGISGSGLSPALTHLSVTITLQPNVTSSGATVALRARVTDNGSSVTNATVSFASSAGGTFYPQTGDTGVGGEVNTSFTTPSVTSVAHLALTASATRSGLLPGSGSANLTVQPTGPYLIATPSFPQGTSVHSSASDLIVVRVTDNHGNPVAGANVTLGTTSGTVTPAIATSGTTGNATLTLRAPTVSVATQVWLLFIATAAEYANGSNISAVTVNSGVAPSLDVTLTLAGAATTVDGGASPGLSARVTNATGVVVVGANVTLILSDGTSSPGSIVTGASGYANFTFSAPSGFTKTTNVTITASATASGYQAGSATVTVAVSPSSASQPNSSAATYWWLWLLGGVIAVVIVVAVVARRRRNP